MMRSLESSEPSRPFYLKNIYKYFGFIELDIYSHINEESQFAGDALGPVQLHQPSILAVLYCPTYAAVPNYQFPAAYQ